MQSKWIRFGSVAAANAAGSEMAAMPRHIAAAVLLFRNFFSPAVWLYGCAP
jgi:hypothetical protein